MKTRPIYLDYNGTTPLDPQVIVAMRPYIEEEFGNPSSSHWYGIEPKRALIKARRHVADMLNCTPDEILFTSGGTESNNHAILGTVLAAGKTPGHVITSQVEHPAVLEVCRRLERLGHQVTYVPVDGTGTVDPSDVEAAMRPHTVLVTIMHANNEVGTIQPIREIGRIARERGISFHTDAAQSIGKIPTDVNDLEVGLLSIAGHKLYAPKGIGALYLRKGTRIEPFMLGAGQEIGRRAGTENVVWIVGLGAACEIARVNLEANMAHMRHTRDLLHQGLGERLGDVMRLNGHAERRLPNTLSVSFRDLEVNRILEEIGLDVAASAGAACHSDHVEVSHVLQAMKVPLEWAKGTIRLSTGRMTTIEEIARATEVLADAVTRLARQ